MDLITLSVIIPTLNEADNLPTFLESLKNQNDIAIEIIIGDGGSTDQSQQIAEAAGALWVASEKGRGRQMNAAAAQAKGEFLLFLHADSTINDPYLFANAHSFLMEEMSRRNRQDIAGHFKLRFVRNTAKNTLAYDYLEAKSALNRKNTTNGDQGFMFSRSYFEKLDGFNESLPYLEDQELAERIRKNGIWVTLPGQLQTSARRFEKEGFHRRYILMSIMMGCFNLGDTTFFKRAADLYQPQQHTEFLHLTPFFKICWQMMIQDLGFLGSVRFWYRLGKYIRPNSWQLFFFFDVFFRKGGNGNGRYPFLRFHDRYVNPVLDFPFFDAVTGLFSFLWILGVLPIYFGMRESH